MGQAASVPEPEPESMFALSCGQAAFLLFCNCLAAKLFMTTVVRGGLLMKVMPMPGDLAFTSTTEKAKKMADGMAKDVFTYSHRAQLDEAEYSGPLIAVLLFLESKGIEAPMACKLLVFGAFAHFWLQVLTQHRLAQPVGGLPRYVGMFCLANALYGAVFP